MVTRIQLQTWLGNTSNPPHTKHLRVTEQYRRIDDSGRHAAKSWITAHPSTIFSNSGFGVQPTRSSNGRLRKIKPGVTGSGLLQCQTGYRDFDGSIPLFLIAAFAFSDERDVISRLAASGSFEPATRAAVNTERYWISTGIGPTKLNPGT